MREYYWRMTSWYIVKNKVIQYKRGGYRVLKWVTNMERYVEHAVCRITCLYDFHLYDNDDVN